MKRLLTCLAVAAALVAASPAAHAAGHSRAIAEVQAMTGVTVPPLDHGYLKALEAHRTEVQTLARELMPADPLAVELDGYIDRQFAAAWYGLLPDSYGENSPAHVPIHGTMAATQQLLYRLQNAFPDNADVAKAADGVLASRQLLGVDVTVCRYSGVGFDTAQPVGIDWSKSLSHGPTLALMLGLLGGFAALLLALTYVPALLAKRAARVAVPLEAANDNDALDAAPALTGQPYRDAA